MLDKLNKNNENKKIGKRREKEKDLVAVNVVEVTVIAVEAAVVAAEADIGALAVSTQ